jgi:hypothetical protein
MAESIYAPRVTNDNGKITAWIDKDGNICIEQPNHPNLLGTEQNWASETDALEWAVAHSAELQTIHEQQLADVEQKKVLQATQLEAAQAQIDSLVALKQQNETLTALLAKFTTTN